MKHQKLHWVRQKEGALKPKKIKKSETKLIYVKNFKIVIIIETTAYKTIKIKQKKNKTKR